MSNNNNNNASTSSSTSSFDLNKFRNLQRKRQVLKNQREHSIRIQQWKTSNRSRSRSTLTSSTMSHHTDGIISDITSDASSSGTRKIRESKSKTSCSSVSSSSSSPSSSSNTTTPLLSKCQHPIHETASILQQFSNPSIPSLSSSSPTSLFFSSSASSTSFVHYQQQHDTQNIQNSNNNNNISLTQMSKRIRKKQQQQVMTLYKDEEDYNDFNPNHYNNNASSIYTRTYNNDEENKHNNNNNNRIMNHGNRQPKQQHDDEEEEEEYSKSTSSLPIQQQHLQNVHDVGTAGSTVVRQALKELSKKYYQNHQSNHSNGHNNRFLHHDGSFKLIDFTNTRKKNHFELVCNNESATDDNDDDYYYCELLSIHSHTRNNNDNDHEEESLGFISITSSNNSLSTTLPSIDSRTKVSTTYNKDITMSSITSTTSTTRRSQMIQQSQNNVHRISNDDHSRSNSSNDVVYNQDNGYLQQLQWIHKITPIQQHEDYNPNNNVHNNNNEHLRQQQKLEQQPNQNHNHLLVQTSLYDDNVNNERDDINDDSSIISSLSFHEYSMTKGNNKKQSTCSSRWKVMRFMWMILAITILVIAASSMMMIYVVCYYDNDKCTKHDEFIQTTLTMYQNQFMNSYQQLQNHVFVIVHTIIQQYQSSSTASSLLITTASRNSKYVMNRISSQSIFHQDKDIKPSLNPLQWNNLFFTRRRYHVIDSILSYDLFHQMKPDFIRMKYFQNWTWIDEMFGILSGSNSTVDHLVHPYIQNELNNYQDYYHLANNNMTLVEEYQYNLRRRIIAEPSQNDLPSKSIDFYHPLICSSGLIGIKMKEIYFDPTIISSIQIENETMWVFLAHDLKYLQRKRLFRKLNEINVDWRIFLCHPNSRIRTTRISRRRKEVQSSSVGANRKVLSIQHKKQFRSILSGMKNKDMGFDHHQPSIGVDTQTSEEVILGTSTSSPSRLNITTQPTNDNTTCSIFIETLKMKDIGFKPLQYVIYDEIIMITSMIPQTTQRKRLMNKILMSHPNMKIRFFNHNVSFKPYHNKNVRSSPQHRFWTSGPRFFVNSKENVTRNLEFKTKKRLELPRHSCEEESQQSKPCFLSDLDPKHTFPGEPSKLYCRYPEYFSVAIAEPKNMALQYLNEEAADDFHNFHLLDTIVNFFNIWRQERRIRRIMRLKDASKKEDSQVQVAVSHHFLR